MPKTRFAASLFISRDFLKFKRQKNPEKNGFLLHGVLSRFRTEGREFEQRYTVVEVASTTLKKHKVPMDSERCVVARNGYYSQ